MKTVYTRDKLDALKLAWQYVPDAKLDSIFSHHLGHPCYMSDLISPEDGDIPFIDECSDHLLVCWYNYKTGHTETFAIKW